MHEVRRIKHDTYLPYLGIERAEVEKRVLLVGMVLVIHNVCDKYSVESASARW